eukprot:8581525-Alexandrium_andersonii.AAC.1
MFGATPSWSAQRTKRSGSHQHTTKRSARGSSRRPSGRRVIRMTATRPTIATTTGATGGRAPSSLKRKRTVGRPLMRGTKCGSVSESSFLRAPPHSKQGCSHSPDHPNSASGARAG